MVDRIKLTCADGLQFEGRGGKHHWVPLGLAMACDGGKVRLSAYAEAAFDLFEQAG